MTDLQAFLKIRHDRYGHVGAVCVPTCEEPVEKHREPTKRSTPAPDVLGTVMPFEHGTQSV